MRIDLISSRILSAHWDESSHETACSSVSGKYGLIDSDATRHLVTNALAKFDILPYRGLASSSIDDSSEDSGSGSCKDLPANTKVIGDAEDRGIRQFSRKGVDQYEHGIM